MTNASPHITRLVHRAPLDLLRELVTKESAALGGAVPWERDPKEVRAALKTAVLDLPRAERHALDRLCERIDHMADEAGIEAISYIHDEIVDISEFEQLGDQYARSLWLYLRECHNFHRAEDTRYADAYRGSPRIYSAFRAPKHVRVELTDERRHALTGALAEFFRTQAPVLVDHFVRPHLDLEEDKEVALHQFSIQHNGEPQSVETIQEDGDIGLLHFCPANSVNITYEPGNGVVEIFSRDRNIRSEIYRLFARHVLDHEVEAEAVPLRNYDLSSLASARELPTTNPEIASVRIAALRYGLGARGSHRTVTVGERDERSIYRLANDHPDHHNAAEEARPPDQARLVMRFHKQPGQRRGKALEITITLPNGCNIKSHCDKDRQIADQHIRLWGLIASDDEDDVAGSGRA